LIAHLAGTTVEALPAHFDAVHDRVLGFISKWQALPASISSTVYKLIEQQVDLTEVRDVVERVSTITDADLRKLIETEVGKFDFPDTPVARLLETMGERGALSLLAKPIADVKTLAGKISAVLDDGAVEDVLNKFQEYVESQLHLKNVLQDVTEADFA